MGMIGLRLKCTHHATLTNTEYVQDVLRLTRLNFVPEPNALHLFLVALCVFNLYFCNGDDVEKHRVV